MKELAALQDKLAPLEVQYNAEKARLNQIRDLNQQREELVQRLTNAEYRRDLPIVADIKYGALPELDATLEKLMQQMPERPMLAEAVTPEEIAKVVSRWTGIPVTKLGEEEKRRLLELAQRLKARVVGQDDAIDQVADAVLRARAGLGREGVPQGSFLFLGPTGKVGLCIVIIIIIAMSQLYSLVDSPYSGMSRTALYTH